MRSSRPEVQLAAGGNCAPVSWSSIRQRVVAAEAAAHLTGLIAYSRVSGGGQSVWGYRSCVDELFRGLVSDGLWTIVDGASRRTRKREVVNRVELGRSWQVGVGDPCPVRPHLTAARARCSDHERLQRGGFTGVNRYHLWRQAMTARQGWVSDSGQ